MLQENQESPDFIDIAALVSTTLTHDTTTIIIMIAMIPLFLQQKRKNSEKTTGATLFLKFSRANELILRRKIRVKCALLSYICCFFFITRLDFPPYNGKKCLAQNPHFFTFFEGLFVPYKKDRYQRVTETRSNQGLNMLHEHMQVSANFCYHISICLAPCHHHV